MKIDKSIGGSFVLLLLMATLYRVIPGRPLGFAPQIAMALFSGSVVTNRKYSFFMPLASMLLSDLIYELLVSLKLSAMPGFYNGQWTNYLLFIAITVIGFGIKKDKWLSIAAGSIAGVAFFFFASNFMVWVGGGLALNNLPYSKTLEGLESCMIAGLPFLSGSLYSTLLFSGIFFGTYHLLQRYLSIKPVRASH